MLRKFLAGTAVTLVCLLGATAASAAARPGDHPKLDRKLNDRAAKGGSGTSRVIVMLTPGFDASADYRRVGAKLGRRLNLINGRVVELTNNQLRKLADSPAVASIHWDRPTGGELNRAAVAVGARAVQEDMGYDGAGVGVAVIDSGITSWHDDLTYNGTNTSVRVVNGQRVAKFVDFVNGRTTPYDDNGHGSHVSGIIAGNGYDTRGARAGIAPAAHLVSLKVLDDHGGGYISNVIAALDWVVQNKDAYNVRVVNLSVGAKVTESYNTDPLTLAAKRVVDAGVVVVTAAGNLGRNAAGQAQYGAITAPGNAPWVLTVGAYSHQGTVTRVDDVMAPYSSRGPTAIDFAAKPDVVAPGTGIVSLAAPESLTYTTKAAYLLNGSVATAYKPYLSLTGTSMASPFVAGTVALMIQANPWLTPNLVKAIVEYTAQNYGYDPLTQGAGFLNARGAVQLARFYATAQAGQRIPSQKPWSKTILWGNHKLTRGVIKPTGSAWATSTVWGSPTTVQGQNIVWGTATDSDNIVWGTSLLDAYNIVWGTISAIRDGENIVWGTSVEGDNIVWGTTGLVGTANIVWGTTCTGADCENIVWGTSLQMDFSNIVWGTDVGTVNIVWGTSGEVDNIVWGTSSEADNVTWGCSGEETPPFDDPDMPSVFDGTSFDSLFPPEIAPAAVVTDPDASIMTTTTTTTTTVIDATTSLSGGVL
jgi:serine protease AprX